MVQCPQCMFDNEPAAAACEQCGAELGMHALSMQLGEVCRSCDSYNDPGVRVCVSCGQPLGSPESEPPAEEAEAAEPLAASPSETTLPPAVALPVSQPPAAAEDEPEEELHPLPEEEEPRPAPLSPTQPWLAAPDTGKFAAAAPRQPSAPAPGAIPAAAATTSPRAVAPLPPGALPPGWAAFQQKAPPPLSRPGPEGALPCARCNAENPPSARFCGTCGTALVPQPGASRARAKLILIRGIAGEGRQFPLTLPVNPAGRSEGALSFPEDPYVAPHHATFAFRGEELFVKDEGAGNGIYVRLREATMLRPGDMFVVGERLLRFAGLQGVVGQPGRHGSPRTTDRLQVIEEVLEGGGIGRVCKRPGPIVTIGRAGCDLNFPADGFVSARHAEISLAGETAFLRDLGSANGTFLRVQPRSERALHHGDYLLLGRELLRVELAAAR